MPFIRVSYMEQHYGEVQLKHISQVIMKALVDHFNVPEDDCFQAFHAHKKEEFYYHPHYLNVQRSDGLIFIHITCKSGRSIRQKTGLYQQLAQQLSIEVPMRQEDVFIVINENEFADWSFGNGIAQMISVSEEVSE
ncbi:tautomerase family protein [Paenibacillus bovis]|uniref:Tautomerase n=1 Tax=Paenibacillus bovis TaxID=1616788 RepID=A0A172ZBH7_9BACL|nr:tautomerase family protein [Paenibacillus bovis]ANF95006.1 tautomerase [Paenibacillus bovis]